MNSADFEITIAGRPATLAELLPGFDEHARLGIVVTENRGGAGAAMLVLAAVSAFYDRLRAVEPDFFAYPDYFAFHVGRNRIAPSHTMGELDVFPEHKEPVVDDDAETVLRAINDRAITHLLVPDRGPNGSRPPLGRDTRSSAQRRIRTAIAYSPSRRVTDPDTAVTGGAQAEQFVTAMLGQPRSGVVVGAGGRTRETYRRLPLDAALGMLETTPQ